MPQTSLALMQRRLEKAQAQMQKYPHTSRNKLALIADTSPATIKKWEREGLLCFQASDSRSGWMKTRDRQIGRPA